MNNEYLEYSGNSYIRKDNSSSHDWYYIDRDFTYRVGGIMALELEKLYRRNNNLDILLG